ncbi:MAG: hypothetical protein AAFX03_08780 [Pseudomonadota bacterium]
MSRFEELVATVDTYQGLAKENYDRIRRVAEEIAGGFCEFLGTADGVCVHLVPPVGPFEPKPYGDQAFSMPPRGFRPLGPVAFGLAVRVSRGTDWLRLTMECRKIGDLFIVQIQGGPEFEFKVPLSENHPEAFYDMVYNHVRNWFAEHIERYQKGDYGSREIGFDFTAGEEAAQV